MRLFNENCTDTYCICQFVKEYEKTSSLNLSFSNGESGTSDKEVFGKLQLLEWDHLIMQKITGSDQNPALIYFCCYSHHNPVLIRKRNKIIACKVRRKQK
jgi:hypothetical protein